MLLYSLIRQLPLSFLGFCLLFGFRVCVYADPLCQYAYIGGYQGIFEFKVRADGSLMPLQTKPVYEGKYLDAIFVDPGTHTLYATSVDDKLYSYAIDRGGHLQFKSVRPFSIVSLSADIDTQRHLLYALGGNDDIRVYDVSHPRHVQERQIFKIPKNVHGLFLDRGRRVLWLLGDHKTRTGQTISGILFPCPLPLRQQSLTNPRRSSSVPGLPTTLVSARHYIVTANFGSTLTVYDATLLGKTRRIGQVPFHDPERADLPSCLVFDKRGSFLYVTTYNGTQSARVDAAPTRIFAYHLNQTGHLRFVAEVGQPTSNPRPYLDNTGRFLYTVSEDESVYGYQIVSGGRLHPCGPRLQIAAPANMVFVSSRN